MPTVGATISTFCLMRMIPEVKSGSPSNICTRHDAQLLILEIKILKNVSALPSLVSLLNPNEDCHFASRGRGQIKIKSLPSF
jgi:hypothetical protein